VSFPRNFLNFLSGNDAFLCILGTCFNVSIRHVKVKTVKKQFCVHCIKRMETAFPCIPV